MIKVAFGNTVLASEGCRAARQPLSLCEGVGFALRLVFKFGKELLYRSLKVPPAGEKREMVEHPQYQLLPMWSDAGQGSQSWKVGLGKSVLKVPESAKA